MTLFPVEPLPSREKISVNGKRRTDYTAANKALLAAGVHPATRVKIVANGQTCGTCEHSVRIGGGRRAWWKCRQHRLGPSRSEASDIRRSWPACELWRQG